MSGASGEDGAALLALVRALAARAYAFVTITPASHARVLARAGDASATSLRDLFGWNLPFQPDAIEPELLRLIDAADGRERQADGRWRSRWRVSSLGGRLFLHSAYPTEAEDAVFFGPDSYRFAALIEAELSARPPRAGARLVDIGTGSGVGALVAATAIDGGEIWGTDVNAAALALAAINAETAGVTLRTRCSSDLDGIGGELDLVLANPPYIIDASERAYRHGGGMHGGAVALAMAEMGVARLAPGGRVILYTGSAIVAGEDALGRALGRLADGAGCTLRYAEIDPDVFGEELDNPAYRDVDRIALVSAVITRPE